MHSPVERLLRVCVFHYFVVTCTIIVCPLAFNASHANLIIMLVSFFNTICVTERCWEIQLEMMQTLSAGTKQLFIICRMVTVVAVALETMVLVVLLSASTAFA